MRFQRLSTLYHGRRNATRARTILTSKIAKKKKYAIEWYYDP